MIENEVIASVYAILDARTHGLEFDDGTPLGSGGLGLDSIALVEVLLECEDRFGVDVAAEALAQSPLTVGLLIEKIRVLVQS